MRNKSLIKYVVGALLVIGIVFSTVNSLREVESKNEGSKVLENKIAELKSKIESLETLNKEYSDFLNSVAESQFRYIIKVNEESVPKDGVVKVSKGTFKVTIYQESLTYIVLPPNFPDGKLSGEDYSEHMVFIGQDELKVEGYDGGAISAVEYTFEEGYSFDSLEIQITEELKERLDLETNIIKIIVE